jgi:hypothetical protein
MIPGGDFTTLDQEIMRQEKNHNKWYPLINRLLILKKISFPHGMLSNSILPHSLLVRGSFSWQISETQCSGRNSLTVDDVAGSNGSVIGLERRFDI